MKRFIQLPGSPQRARRDMDEELRFHLEGRIEDLVAQGMTRDDAEREALRRFGDREQVEAEVARIDATTLRQARWYELAADALRAVRYASRGLARRPLYAAAIVLTLALGIGANAAVFSAVHAVLLKPFAFPELDRLAVVRDDFPAMGLRNAAISPLEALDLFEHRELFESATAVGGEGATMEIGGEPTRTVGSTTIGEFFRVFGARPLLGRFYGPEDSQVGRAPVVVLSHRLWQQLAGDSAIIGRSLVINDQSFQVIGVASADFSYPRTALYWRPFVLDSAWTNQETRRGSLVVAFVGRLRDGVTVERLGRELRVIADQWHRQYSAYAGGQHTMIARSFVDYQAGQLKPTITALFAAVVLVLLLACANVAGLQLVRAAGRASELAVRAALGAGRGAIARQLLLESTLLTIAGAIAGIVLGRAALTWLTHLQVTQFPALAGLTLNAPVLAFTVGVAVVTGVIIGLAPAFRAARLDVNEALRSSGRGSSAGAARHRLLRASVVVQNALTVLLLIGAGLTLRSLERLLRVDPGFEPAHVTAFTMSLPPARYTNAAQRLAFFSQLEERLAAIPGVESVGFALGAPFTGAAGSTMYTLDGVPMQPGEPQRHANQAFVFGDFYRTMGIPIRRGRAFGDEEFASGASAMVVDETLVRQSFGTGDPLGAKIEHGPAGTIIGVAKAVKLNDLAEEAHPLVYHNYAASAGYIGALTAVVRSALPTEQVLRLARSAVRELDPTLPIANGLGLQERVNESLGVRRVVTYVLGGFGVLSLVLALLGVYAVMSHVVADRTREIGIRTALGAQRREIVGMVLGEGMVLSLLGLAIGAAVFLGARRLVEGLLFEVAFLDLVTILGSVALLGIATLLACGVPAWRAVRVDPSITLKQG
jgi:predicted permease